jgi:hypothetical protein
MKTVSASALRSAINEGLEDVLQNEKTGGIAI